MKRVFSACLSCLLLISLCACTSRETKTPEKSTDAVVVPVPGTSAPKPTQPVSAPVAASQTDIFLPEPLSDEAWGSLAQVRQMILDDNAVFALAFIGYVDPRLCIAESIETYSLLEESGYGECFPFMKEMTPMQCCDNECSELYCLVPFSEGDLVVIEEAETFEGEPVEPYTEVYRSSSGDPVFFTLDSNGWGGSNVFVTVTDARGKELRCNPGMLSNLGMLAPLEAVSDFTIYPEGSPATMMKMMRGEWSCSETVDGIRYNYWLELHGNGEAALDIAVDGSPDQLMEYQGWWSPNYDFLVLELGLLGGTEYELSEEEQRLSSGFDVEFVDDSMVLTLNYGDSFLLSGTEEAALFRSYG